MNRKLVAHGCAGVKSIHITVRNSKRRKPRQSRALLDHRPAIIGNYAFTAQYNERTTRFVSRQVAGSAKMSGFKIDFGLQIEMERNRLSPQVGLNLEHQCVETH